jgi:uncharacterized membrane protein YkvA (DUF1232 family)
MLKLLKEKATNLSHSGKSFAGKAKEKLQDSGIADSMSKKAKAINVDVIKEWTKDKDSPDKRELSEKLKDSAKKVGEELYVLVMQGYLALVDSETDTKHKAILGAALAYFVLPADIIPDVIVGVGFTDDVAALALAARNVGDAIQEKHVESAKEKWNEFAGIDEPSQQLENNSAS